MRKRFTIKDDKSTFTATMDARVLEPPPIVHIEFTDLDSESKYRFPYICKYVAWLIILATQVTSCTVLVLYGEYFSRLKTYLWVAAFTTSFLLGSLLLEPAKILLRAVVKSYILGKSVVIRKRTISRSLVWNPENPEKKRKILNFRRYKAKLYNPTPLHRLQNRSDDIMYHLEMKTLFIDTFIYILLLVSNLMLLDAPLSNARYYNNNAAVEAFLNGRYTHSITFNDVKTYDTFLEYVNETLLPALFPGFVNNTEIEVYNRRRRGRRDSTERQKKPPPDNFRKMQLLSHVYKMFDYEDIAQAVVNDTGWTITRNSKLMGRARMRQVRVRSEHCKEYKDLKPRNVECAPELNLLNVETRNFTLSWNLFSSSELTESQQSPWKYQSAWKTTTLPIFTKNNIYPGGGYILELARNIEDSRLILEYLDTFQWVDIRTRAIFIEFTIYCINTNFFDVVTLIIERSATGYLIPSFVVDTRVFILDMSVTLALYVTICCGILFWLLIRELQKLYRTSFMIYINRSTAVIDISVVVCGIIRILLVGVNHTYVTLKVRSMEHSQNNKFFGFAYAAFWAFMYDFAGAVLTCSVYIQLLRLSSYKVVFHHIHKTLGESYKRFMDLIFHKMILMITFALFFHIIFLYRFESLSSFGEATVTQLCRKLVSHNYLDHKIISSSMFVAPIVFFFFVILISIFSVNAFLAVMCLYYRKVRQVPLYDRYHFFKYMMYCMTFWRHKDFVKFKERGVVDADADDNPFSTLRLRGGGHKMSKKCKAKKEYDEDTDEFLKVYLTDLVIKKPYDVTEYLDLSVEHVAALKYLMMYYLAKDVKAKTIFSEYAIRALFCALSTKNKATASEERPPPYFFVVKEGKTEVFDRRILLDMRKVVEDFGKKAGIVWGENINRDEVAVGENLAVLDRKLCLLLKKLDLK